LNSEKLWKIQRKSKLKSENIWKLWRKSKLNSEKIWKIWKKGKLNNDMILKIWKISVLVTFTPKETSSSSLPPPPPPPPPAATIVAIYTYPRAAAAIALKCHPKHVTNKNKTKHIMKISHISVNIYDKTATSQ
jgi:hypothetical protein